MMDSDSVENDEAPRCGESATPVRDITDRSVNMQTSAKKIKQFSNLILFFLFGLDVCLILIFPFGFWDLN